MHNDLGTIAWANEVIAKGQVTARDVARLCNDLCPMGLMTLDEAEALFGVERSVLDKHASWASAFTTMVGDYLIWGERPTGSMTADRAEWVLKLAARTGTQATEDLLWHIASDANQAPAWFIKAVEQRGRPKPAFATISAIGSQATCAA